MKRTSVFFLSIFIFSNLTCQSDTSVPIKINRLSKRVAVFEALNVNVTVVASADGLLIFDTQRSPGIMSDVLKLIRKEFGRSKVHYVINTHGHWDHASGNQLFPDSIIIGHSNCPEYMRQNPANSIVNIWSIRNHLKELKQELDTLQENTQRSDGLRAEITGRQMVLSDFESRYVTTPPGITFQDSLILKLSDLTLKLFYAGNAHTDHDIIVYIPEEKIAVTGDLFTTRTYYGFRVNQMINAERLIQVIDRILCDKSGIERIITSHTDQLTEEDLHVINSTIQEKYGRLKDKNSAARLLEELLQHNQPAVAEKEYEKRISVPGGEYYYLEDEFTVLGRRLMGAGRHEAALTVFKKECDTFRESALAYDNLGEIYLKMGNTEKAIRNYEESLRIMPYNKNAEEILKIIRK
ncbi:MAG: MBL fold metallo-hydrolase [bacterium]|nr:MAG: MBL fold metallo-hydrolase [bacterium]